MKEENNFNEEEIRFLPPRDAVRLRTSMYLGSTEKSDVMIREIIDNSCDEISEGYGDTVLVSNNFNGFCLVSDNGRGLPISMSKDKPDITQAELSISELHSGSKFESTESIARVGLNGIGSTAINFTSQIYIILSKITDSNYNKSIPPVQELWENSGPRSKKDLFYILVMEEGIKVYEGAGKLKDLEKMIFKGCKEYISIPENQSTIVLFKPDPKIWDNCIPDIPMTNLQYFLLIQEKFYGRKVNVVIDGINIRSTFNPYKFELVKTIVPKDTSMNKQVGLYITFEIDSGLGNAQVYGSVNGLDCNDGMHINLGKNLYKTALKSYFGIKHDYLLNGLKMVIIILANEVQYNSQTKENLKQITKVRPADFDEALKDFQKIFKKNEDYWLPHVEKLNLLAESMKSISAVEKAEAMIAAASGNAIYRNKSNLVEGFSDATYKDRWECELFLCFTGDTEMLTCNDEKIKLENLVDRISNGESIYTFSCKSNGKIIPAKVIGAKKIGETNKLCIVTLDNGEIIKCTLDHELMLRDGSYKQAKDLIPGDSMMPCYITKSKRDRESDQRRLILDMGGDRTDVRPEKKDDFSKAVGGRLIPIYRVMSEHEDAIIDESSKLPGIKINRHHLDKNKLNDYPTNVLICSSEKHSTFHVKDASKAAHKKAHEDIDTYNKMYVFNKQTDTFRNEASERFKKFYSSSEGAKAKEVLREKAKEEWSSKELRDWRSKETRNYSKNHPGWAKENSKKSHVSFWREKEIPTIKDVISKNNLGELTSLNFNKAVLITAKDLGSINRFASYESIKEIDSDILKDFTEVDNSSLDYARVLLVLEELEKRNLQVNVNNYNNIVIEFFEKPCGRNNITASKGYRRACKQFPDLIKEYQSKLNNNHSIVSVEIIDVDNLPVYCLEVDTVEHNFPLAAGIFAKNCEGLSPAGSLKSGRRPYKGKGLKEAVLPLKGKILNVSDKTIDQALTNKEISTIFSVLGVGIQEKNVTSDCKTREEALIQLKKYSHFGKICIACDADSDGQQITSLILYLFSKYARFLIDLGCVFVSLSPLFEQDGKYFYPNDPIDPNTGFPVGLLVNKYFRRWKGLGSIPKELIYDSFFNPATRRLVQVTPEGLDYAMSLTEDIEERKKLLYNAGILTNPYNFTDL